MHHFLARLKVRELSTRAKRLLMDDRVEEGRSIANEAFNLAQEFLSPDDVEYVLTCSFLAMALGFKQDDVGVIRLLEPVVPIAETVLSEIPFERHALLNNLSVSYLRNGEPNKAIFLMERVITDKSKVYGEDSPKLLGNLEDLLQAYDSASQFGEAEHHVRHLLRIVEIGIGVESREYLGTLQNLIACLNEKGDTAEAGRQQHRAGTIHDNLSGKQSEKLEQQAKQAYLEWNFPEAKRLHRALLAITPHSPFLDAFQVVMGGDMFDPMTSFASGIDKQGVTAEQDSDWEEAIRCYRVTSEIFDVNGDYHGVLRGQAFNNLAIAYQKKGDLASAKRYFSAAFRSLESSADMDNLKAVKTNTINLFWDLADQDAPDPSSNLERAVEKIGEYTGQKGEGYARSLKIQFPIPNPDDDSVDEFTRWLNARITYYLSAGAIEPAYALHQHIVELHELFFANEPGRVLYPLLLKIRFSLQYGALEGTRALLDQGMELLAESLEDHLIYAVQLLRLESQFRHQIKDDLGAEDALLSARQLLDELPDEPKLRDSIEENLLILWLKSGKQGDEVDLLLDERIKLLRERVDTDHPDAESLRLLADLMGKRGRQKESEELYRHALEIQRERLGESDPRYAMTLVNLASLLRLDGRYAEALPLFEQAVRIRELEFGDHDSTVVSARLRLALTLGGLGLWERTAHEMERVLESGEIFLSATAAVASREQLFRALNQERVNLDLYLTTCLNLADSAQQAEKIYEAVLRRKGLSAEALANRRLPLLSERYPQHQDALSELDKIASIISEHYTSSGHSELDLHEAQARKYQIEIELASQIPEIRFESAWHNANAKMIRGALGEHSLLLEFVRYKPFNFDGRISNGDPEFLPSRYLGFLVRKSTEIELVDLGPAKEIDCQITDFGHMLAGEAGGLRGFVFPDEGGEDDEVTASLESLVDLGQQLCSVLWDPLISSESTPERILIAPDGQISLVPFDLLTTTDGQLLFDRFLISNLGSGRDLIRLAEPQVSETSEPVIFCAPDYDFPIYGTNPDTAQQEFARNVDEAKIRHFPPLPGSAREGRQLQALMPDSQLFSAQQATEEEIRKVRSPIVLHIATHGFSTVPKDEDRQDDGMFHSGLIFAGANEVMRNKEISLQVGDAILTGEEAATLNLAGTELVVLSACRSGIGTVVPGEGVFGLNRAFASAGARCVITSLWKIPDDQTSDLMTFFYHALCKGHSRADALREAKLQIRKKHPHPFFWGSFLCHGESGKIEKLNWHQMAK